MEGGREKRTTYRSFLHTPTRMVPSEVNSQVAGQAHGPAPKGHLEESENHQEKRRENTR